MRRVLLERARQFRAEPTRSERLLWSELRGGALGARFYRQKNVGPFIPDFLAERPKLIVEIDGAVHDQTVVRDAERQRWLEARGYLVCRVTADAVEQRMTDVLIAILQHLEDARRPRLHKRNEDAPAWHQHPPTSSPKARDAGALLVPAASPRE